jgi:two-component system sensor histidine kinase EvgS
MTADARPDQRDICREAGMDDLLRKPIRLEAFHDMVARWLAAGDSGLPSIDMERMRRAFGSDENIVSVIRAGITATRDALGRLPEVRERAAPGEVAGWVHHVLGGVNVYGPSTLAEEGERMELGLREGADVDLVAVDRFAAGVAGFVDGLDRLAATMAHSACISRTRRQ